MNNNSEEFRFGKDKDYEDIFNKYLELSGKQNSNKESLNLLEEIINAKRILNLKHIEGFDSDILMDLYKKFIAKKEALKRALITSGICINQL